jgi:arylformamidase
MNMPTKKIYELSHDVIPFREEYKFEIENKFVDEFLPYYKGFREEDSWYIMTDISMWSHVGTHIESPYHYIKEGTDVAEIPLESLVGECVLLDFTNIQANEGLTLKEFKKKADLIRENDIVFLRFGLSKNYRTEMSRIRPYLETEVIEQLVSKKIKCLGVDMSGIEKRGIPDQPNHRLLFSNNIPLIEHLANLDKITQPRFFVVAVPIRMHGVDACPVSVIAIA